MASQAQRCVQDLRALGSHHSSLAARVAGERAALLAQGWTLPEPVWKEVARRQHAIDGARTMISRAATIGPAALEPVVLAVSRAHEAAGRLDAALMAGGETRTLP